MSYSIEKTPDKKYRIRVWGPINEFGKRVTKQKSNIPTAGAAKALALEIDEQLKSEGTYNEYTYKQLYDLYMENKLKNLSPTTIKNKETTRKRVLEKWGNVKAKNINTRNCQEWVNSLEKMKNIHQKNQRLKKATIQEYVKQLNTVLNWAVGQNFLDVNRIRKIEYLPDEEPFEATILNAEDIGKILKSIKKDCYNIYIPVLISLLADPRRGEVLALDKNLSLNFDNDTIQIKRNAIQVQDKTIIKNNLKTKSSKRILSMSDFLKHEILEHIKLNQNLNSNFLCDNIFIGEVKPSYVTHKFKDFMLEKFNINMRFHDLRHNFNQLCYEGGVDSKTRSQMLGHSNQKITNQVYTHFSKKKTKAAVETITDIILNNDQEK